MLRLFSKSLPHHLRCVCVDGTIANAFLWFYCLSVMHIYLLLAVSSLSVLLLTGFINLLSQSIVESSFIGSGKVV